VNGKFRLNIVVCSNNKATIQKHYCNAHCLLNLTYSLTPCLTYLDLGSAPNIQQYLTLPRALSKFFSNHDTMPDELDVRDDREEAHEEGGDDEVCLNAVTAGSLHRSPACSPMHKPNG